MVDLDTEANVDRIEDVDALEERLSRPSPAVVAMMQRLEGDIILLGAAGKMGPTLARMTRRASDDASTSRRVIAVSRFSQAGSRDQMEAWGVETIKADLLDAKALADLPDAPNIVYMAGMKFGATGNEALTWAMNCWLPGMVAQRYAGSRIAAFSTGNVYGLASVTSGGSREGDEPNPQGEYAMSCLGRERMFEHFSRAAGTRVSLIRLNYACELRYGVLVDLAQKIIAGEPIPLGMGVFNVIWQGDANAHALLSLEHAASPAWPVNITGPEAVSVHAAAQQLGAMLDREPVFEGEATGSAILSNAQQAHRLFGYPEVSVDRMMRWVADWVQRGGASLGKPTHYEVRDGKF
ncbi:MAG: NAD-dependent epimerase/dehydratase family protein [Phycisphaeraceae bacterium]